MARCRVNGGLQHLVEPVAAAHRGELLEHPLHVGGKVDIAGQQAEIRVDPGRTGMVVAGAEVGVPAQLGTFPADHENHLGVGLVADDAVDHLGTGLLEVVRQFDVGGFVESRPQLDDDQHFLAPVGGVQEDLDRRRVGARAVQGLTDRQDVGILGRAAQEVEYRHEGMERVVQQDVARADRREDVRGGLDACGNTRR